MGNVFNVDTAEILEKKKKISELINKCESKKSESRPVSAVAQGAMKEKMESICDDISETWDKLILLMKNTEVFLVSAAGIYDTSDKNQADAIKK